MEIILKPADIAQILQVGENTVLELLQSGALAGFKLSNEWRVVGAELVRFLNQQTQAQQLEILARRLSDPSEWTSQLSDFPDLKVQVESQTFEEGSLGAFLQKGLKQDELLRHAKDILKPDTNETPEDEDA